MMLLALLVAAAPAAETPKAYMERLYAGYRNSSFNPFDHPERYFAPRLLPTAKSVMSTGIPFASARIPTVSTRQ